MNTPLSIRLWTRGSSFKNTTSALFILGAKQSSSYPTWSPTASRTSSTVAVLSGETILTPCWIDGGGVSVVSFGCFPHENNKVCLGCFQTRVFVVFVRKTTKQTTNYLRNTFQGENPKHRDRKPFKTQCLSHIHHRHSRSPGTEREERKGEDSTEGKLYH